MKARDHAAFTGFLAEETLFSMGSAPLHGAVAVANAWKRFYDRPAALFFCGSRKKSKCWRPARWQCSGPVYGAGGKLISRFGAIWRQEAPGQWRIVFDRGSPECNCKRQL